MADPALQLQNRIEAPRWEQLQLWLLGGKGVGDDPLRRAVDTDVGDGIEPVDKLYTEIFQIAEAPPEEEVFADLAERPLDLSLGLGPIGTTGARNEAIMPRQSQQ